MTQINSQSSQISHLNVVDRFLCRLDKTLRVVAAVPPIEERSNPAQKIAEYPLETNERRHSAGLMRVNHVGEICAQALYEAQAQFARSEVIKQQFTQAAQEEEDHLAWTAQRLRELGSRPSVFNPLWYAGAYAMGIVAAKAGDAHSLGFVVETERQVEAHLASHLQKLPQQDAKSRAIVEQMRTDEAEHGAAAQALGAQTLPVPVRKIMQTMAKIMTTTAYHF